MDNEDQGCIGSVIIIGLFLAACGFFVYLKTNTYDVRLQVGSLEQQRVVPIEQYTALRKDTDVSQMPGDAYDIHRYTTTTRHSRTCSSGSGKNKRSWDCSYTTTNYRARYTINRWIVVENLISIGDDKNTPECKWIESNTDAVLGNRKTDPCYPVYIVHFKLDSETFNYQALNEGVWRIYVVESYWKIQRNRLQEFLWNTLKAG